MRTPHFVLERFPKGDGCGVNQNPGISQDSGVLRPSVLSEAAIVALIVTTVVSSVLRADELPNPFLTGGPNERHQSFERMYALRNQIVNDAVAAYESKTGDYSSDDVRFIPLQAIKKFRATEAVKPLCDGLMDKNVPAGINGDGGQVLVRVRYPAAGALAEMRDPGAQECLSRLLGEGASAKSPLYLWVIRQVYRPEIARKILDEAFGRGNVPHQKLKHGKVLAEFDRLDELLVERDRMLTGHSPKR